MSLSCSRKWALLPFYFFIDLLKIFHHISWRHGSEPHHPGMQTFFPRVSPKPTPLRLQPACPCLIFPLIEGEGQKTLPTHRSLDSATWLLKTFQSTGPLPSLSYFQPQVKIHCNISHLEPLEFISPFTFEFCPLMGDAILNGHLEVLCVFLIQSELIGWCFVWERLGNVISCLYLQVPLTQLLLLRAKASGPSTLVRGTQCTTSQTP